MLPGFPLKSDVSIPLNVMNEWVLVADRPDTCYRWLTRLCLNPGCGNETQILSDEKLQNFLYLTLFSATVSLSCHSGCPSALLDAQIDAGIQSSNANLIVIHSFHIWPSISLKELLLWCMTFVFSESSQSDGEISGTDWIPYTETIWTTGKCTATDKERWCG